MAHEYQYLGARPLRRDNGEVVLPRATFVANEREHTRIVRRKDPLFRLVANVPPTPEVEPEMVVNVPPPEDSEPEETEESTATDASGEDDEDPDDEDAGDSDDEGAEEESGEEWPLKIKPAVYLRLHPEGQHAELARRVTGDG